MSTNIDTVKVSRATVQQLPAGWLEDLPSDEFKNSRSQLKGIEELAKSLKSGQVEPLIVVSKKLPGGAQPLKGLNGEARWTRYYIIEGFRRRAAAMSISPSFMLNCVVRDLKDVPSLQFDNFVGNLDLRHQLPVLDVCDTIVRLQDKGFTAQQIAEKTGKPVDWVNQHAMVGRIAVPELRAAVELNRVSFSIAWGICHEAPSKQLPALEKMLSEPVIAEVKSMAELEAVSPGITRQEAEAEAKSKGPKPKKTTKKEAARATGKVVRPGIRDVKRLYKLFDPEGEGFDARTRKNIRVQTTYLVLKYIVGEISEKKLVKELGIA